MTVYQDQIGGLIDDACLVSAYAARIGQLQDPDFVATASHIRESLKSGKPVADDLAQFLRQFNSTVRAIAPVTLIDLGSKWRPFPASANSRWFNRLLVIFGVIMIGLTAFYTQLYTIAKDTLAVIHAVEIAAIDEKLDALKIFLAEHPNLTPEQQSRTRLTQKSGSDQSTAVSQQDIQAARAVLSNYLKDLRGLNALASQMQTAVFNISREDVLYPPLVLPAYRGLTDIGASVATFLFHRNTALAATDALARPSPELSQEQYLASLNADPAKRNTIDLLKDDSDPALAYQLYGLVSMREVAPRASGYVDFCKRVVLLLGGWFLPAAYGLVGSIVFQMRQTLNPLQPTLPPVRLVFRIALGGFAGIIVGWFWSPSVQSVAVGESLSITAFGIAFLVGYSSEIFFVLLDTMVTTLLTLISRKPASVPNA